jgi:hypothetical protein
VVYGVARIDASGRICERTVIAALGWVGGDRLTSTAVSGVVTALRDPGGMVTLPASGYITIPAALRRRCGLEPGDQVLLAAVPAADMLAAYSFAAVDEAIRAHGSFPNAQGESHDHHPALPRSVTAGSRGRSPADPGADEGLQVEGDRPQRVRPRPPRRELQVKVHQPVAKRIAGLAQPRCRAHHPQEAHHGCFPSSGQLSKITRILSDRRAVPCGARPDLAQISAQILAHRVPGCGWGRKPPVSSRGRAMRANRRIAVSRATP